MRCPGGKGNTGDEVGELRGASHFAPGVGGMDLGVSGRPLLGGGVGRGGRPPLPSPFKIVLVSFNKCRARSCCPLATSPRARDSMSEVSNSMRRWTTDGWGGMGGVEGRALRLCLVLEGSIVIASKEGRGNWVCVPSRSRSHHTRSA